MAGEKHVVKSPKVFLNPAGSNTDVSKFFTKFSPNLTREEIDTAAFGDNGAATEKGTAMHKVAVTFFHSRDFEEFTELMITELNSDDNTVWLFKHDDGTVTDAHPSFQFSVKICDLGDVLGARNTASKADVTWTVQGQITITKAGAVVVTV